MELLDNPVEYKIIGKNDEETKTVIVHGIDQFGNEQIWEVIVPSSTFIAGCDVID